MYTPPPLPSCFLYTIPTLHYALYWTIYSTLYCKLDFTLYCTLNVTLYSSLSFTPQYIQTPKWLADMTLQGTLPFLSLELSAEHYTVQYCTLNCRLYCLTPFKCAVNPNVHWIVSPCCKKKGDGIFFQEIYSPCLLFNVLTHKCTM